MHGTPLFLFPPYRHHHRFALTAQYRKNRPSPSVCANGAMRKTAEERFNMLARGWLAYPVTPIHAHLPPKSGCRSHIPRPANNLYNRSSAVDPLRHNQPQVGRQANLGLRLYNRPSAVASSIDRHPQNPPIIIGLRQRRNPKKTAEERFHTLARGWLAYPVTSIHSHLPPKSGCRKRHPGKTVTPIFYLLHERRSPRSPPR